jgi:WhiB family redox-sensing transcriptional regulator
MTYNVPFSDLGRYKQPWLVTPPAADIIAAVRRGQSYAELAAIYGVSESTLRRRVTDSGLVQRRYGSRPIPTTGRLVDDHAPVWMEQGLCAQTDPEAFFPEIGHSPRAGKQICKACPVVAACLAYALERDERFGVWGGLTPGERKRLKARTQAQATRSKP